MEKLSGIGTKVFMHTMRSSMAPVLSASEYLAGIMMIITKAFSTIFLPRPINFLP
jgi:hypothetical protein